jgi:hypothetical protein
VQHLTFIDRVERPGARSEERDVVRATSWFSADLPGYGGVAVALGKSEGAAGGNLLTSWFPPPAGNSSGFPDTETYQVPASSQAAYEMPSRATSTVLSASWMGTPAVSWSGTPHEMDGRRLRQDITWGETPKIMLSGVLLHSLPGTLEDVTLIHVTPFHTAIRRLTPTNPPLIAPSNEMPSYARMRQLSRWNRDEQLDIGLALYGESPEGTSSKPAAAPRLARDSGTDSAAASIRRNWYDPVLQPNVMSAIDPSQPLEGKRLDMLQLYDMLQPPGYLLDPKQGSNLFRGDAVRVERDMARQVDLSRWFSSPCLIVIGRLHDGGERASLGMPFPFTIDGDEPPADGDTFVRVVFPLPAVPGAMIPPPRPAK